MKIIVVGYGRLGTEFVTKAGCQANEAKVIDKERSAMEGIASAATQV